jgi:hypothetical protein
MTSWYKRLGRHLCNGAIYAICCPCILCLLVGRLTCCPRILAHDDLNDREREQIQKRLERGRELRRVRPLGPVRKRELSQSATLRENEQKDSPLFNRLPPEILTMIWHYVLGGQSFHLTQVPKRVGHHLCDAGATSDPGRSCCLTAMTYWRHEIGTVSYGEYMERFPGAALPSAPLIELGAMPPKYDSHTLALLRTCQRIYRETIEIPYYTNTFDIDDPETLLNLRRTIPRQRLKMIKHLRVYVETQYPPYSGMHSAPWYCSFDGIWTLMWHTIAFDMTGLENLELIIQAGSMFPEWPRKDPSWTSKLRDVRGLKSFQLTVKEGLLVYNEDCDEDLKKHMRGLRDIMYQARPIALREVSPAELGEP